MMTEQMPVSTAETVVLEGLDFEIPCEHPRHAGTEPHSGPGAFWVSAECHHCDAIMCGGFVVACIAQGGVHCGECGRDYTNAEVSYTPLRITS